MYEREFCIYCEPSKKKKFSLDREGDYVLEFQDMGFNQHISLLKPFFYVDSSGVPLVEIQMFINKNGESIVNLWDSHTEIFSFYCGNEKDRMLCIKDLIIIAKNMTAIEKDLKKLVEEDL